MNKFTKIGLSALCGSLATVSAVNAGEMTVTGSAHMTYTQLGHGETGNPLGMKTNLSFAGSGELDGGQTFSLAIDNTDKNVFSAGSIELVTNSLGTFNLSQAGGGNGIGGYDDKAPTAWEEVWDTGAGGGAGGGNGGAGYAGGTGGSGVVILRIPTANYSETTTGSPTVTTDGSYKVVKFTDDGSYTA